ncbi:MAG: T9SS type A sorting domain-containing protein, partial [Hymenobacter sp.]
RIALTYFRGILVCSANTPDATRRELHLYNLANLLTPTVKPLSAIGFEIYPNPAPDFIIIRPAASRTHWAGALFNQLGQKLAELTFTASTPLTIDLRRFPAGVYQLRVEDGREHYTANIVKP